MKKKAILYSIIIVFNIFSFSQSLTNTLIDKALVSDYIPHIKESNKKLTYNTFESKNTINNKTAIMGDFKFDLKNVSINSDKNEYGSGFFKERYIVVSSKKIGAIGGDKNPTTGEHHRQIFCATVKDDGDLEKLVLYSRILNTNKDEGSVTFSQDYKTIYFTRNNFNKNNNYQLYKAFDIDGLGLWLNEEELPFSSENYSIEDIHLSSDESALYFSSNKPSGLGGYDLYVAKIKEDGSLSKPKNLGENVNTELNERYPFADVENNYLYFSSNSYNSLGELDIFKVKKTKNGYSKIINLGPNINSANNDYAFTKMNHKNGYFTSDKSGGKGGSDIYHITLKNNGAQVIKGTVRDAITQSYIPNSTVKLTDIDGRIIETNLTNENGEFNFKVESFENYIINVSNKYYEENSITTNTDTANKKIYYENIDLVKNQKEIIIEENNSISKNIYFQFNNNDLSNISKENLKNIISEIDKPIKKVVLIGHTDYFGNNKYNYKLGLQRAQNVLKVINENNKATIDTQISSQGELKPIVNCKTCDTKALKKNRRVEIYIEY
jgi:outer membrane protein OmpA-like peptidoglycan-associated protein